MRIWGAFLFLTMLVWAPKSLDAQEFSRELAKSLYLACGKNPSLIDSAYREMRNIDVQDDALLQGYKGVITAMMAQRAVNPIVKYKHFITGRDMLEEAIEYDKESVELRCLRLAVQRYCPAFLGYSSDIEVDKDHILDKLRHNQDWKSDPLLFGTVQWLVNSDLCTTEEISSFKHEF